MFKEGWTAVSLTFKQETITAHVFLEFMSFQVREYRCPPLWCYIRYMDIRRLRAEGKGDVESVEGAMTLHNAKLRKQSAITVVISIRLHSGRVSIITGVKVGEVSGEEITSYTEALRRVRGTWEDSRPVEVSTSPAPYSSRMYKPCEVWCSEQES